MCHVRNARLSAPALGDILVSRDPTAIYHRLMCNREGAARWKILRIAASLMRLNQRLLARQHSCQHHVMAVTRRNAAQQVTDRRAGSDTLRRHIEKIKI